MSDNPSQIIYVNAIPKKINVREIYSYFLRIGANPETYLLNDPDNKENQSHGEILIEVPYDGYTYFPIESAENSSEYTTGNDAVGQIGWFALGKPLDWEGDWSPQTDIEEMIPVRIPLRGDQIKETSDWISDRFCAVLTHVYLTEPPRYVPVNIDMHVFESNVDNNLQTPQELLNKSPDQKKLLENLVAKPISGGQLIIVVNISVMIPEVFFGQSNNPIKVIIEDLGLYWPNLVSGSHLKVQQLIDGKIEPKPWRYNPEKKAVQIQNLQMSSETARLRSMLVPFETNLALTLNVPGKLVREGLLDGWVNIRLDNLLLSSRGTAWMDTRGMRVDKSENSREENRINVHTDLKANFSAFLDEKFQQRNSTVYRQWYFHGTSYTPSRLEDIRYSLRDLGYEIKVIQPETHKFENEKNQTIRDVGVVHAERFFIQKDQQPKLMKIQIWAIPVSPAETRVEREIPEGGTVSTQLPTSDMIIQVRGQIDGNGNILALDLDRLMINLKNRFMAVADLR